MMRIYSTPPRWVPVPDAGRVIFVPIPHPDDVIVTSATLPPAGVRPPQWGLGAGPGDSDGEGIDTPLGAPGDVDPGAAVDPLGAGLGDISGDDPQQKAEET